MGLKLSKHELLFVSLLKEAGATRLATNFKFDSERQWLLDIVQEDSKTAIEIDGGGFAYGGHNRGRQMAWDYEKRNAALLQGWWVFQLTGQQVQREGEMWARKIAAWMSRR